MSALLTSLPVCFERKFSLGAYLYSHAQLLLRSGRIGYHEGQRFENHSVIDILFKNVSFMAVAESYVPLEVSFGNTADVERISELFSMGLKGDRRLYVLRGGQSVGYVVAGAVYWTKDVNGSTDEPSALLAYPRPAKLEVFTAR